MTRRLLVLISSVLLSMLWTVTPAATVSISCGAVGKELAYCKSGAEAWAQKNGHQVRVVSTPNSTTERLALYQQLLAAGSKDIDVFQVDVIWPGILAPHFIDLKPFAEGIEDRHFPAVVKNNTIGGRLVAMPWYVTAGMLYYRQDLLDKYEAQVPETWAALTETAQRIQAGERAAGNPKMWGFVWQGRAYEGLTCDALEWFMSHNGGRVLDDSGQVTIDNPGAAKALAQAAAWVGTISPPGVLNYSEEESRGVFQSGNALFMRNWPYAWSLAQAPDSPVRGKVGIASLPKGSVGGHHAATLGGWQLAVSRYSAHPELAADLVMYLTSPQEQKRRALAAAYPPTFPALYEDEQVLASYPHFEKFQATFHSAIARPSAITGAAYNRFSSRVWAAAHSVLTAKRDPQQALKRLHRDLNKLRKRGRW